MAQDTSRMTDQSHHGRVAGSGFTWFQFMGNVVAFAQAISIASPAPVADAVAVQPLNWRRPAEIVVPRAIGPGTLTVTGIELWNQSVWHRLKGLSSAIDLADVFQLMWNQGTRDMTASVVVDPPPGRGNSGKKYFRTYHGIKVTNIDDGENIDITTMLLNKTVTFMYTYVTSQGGAMPAKAAFDSEISTS
jgi:hypothetical protein